MRSRRHSAARTILHASRRRRRVAGVREARLAERRPRSRRITAWGAERRQDFVRGHDSGSPRKAARHAVELAVGRPRGVLGGARSAREGCSGSFCRSRSPERVELGSFRAGAVGKAAMRNTEVRPCPWGNSPEGLLVYRPPAAASLRLGPSMSASACDTYVWASSRAHGIHGVTAGLARLVAGPPATRPTPKVGVSMPR